MPNSGNKKVLIVDDATFIRNRIKKIVEKIENAEVIGEATNGVDAVALYKKFNPDLVTMDLIMPEADGIKAIEDIMKINNKAKIVVVSAMGQEVTVADALEKGAKEYIKKPFKEEDIYKALERFLKAKK
ncbi:MAG: response regulator [Candidatus Hermodarchaeota archaeon]